MASLGSLVVSLAMDTAKFSGDVGKAAQQMARLTAEAGKIGAAIGASIAVGAKVIGSIVKQSIDAADRFGELAEMVGITTEEMSRLGYVAKLSATDQETLATSLGKLSRLAADAASGGKTAGDVFQALGVSVKGTDGTLKGSTELLREIAERLASYKDGAEKSALAQEVFGKQGAALIPLLNRGASGIAALEAEADLLGITLSTSASNAAGEFNDNLDRLNAAQEGIGRRIAEQLLPTLQRLTTGLFDSAKNADLFGRAATIAATGVKLLVSAGAIIVGVFNTIGSALGGIAGALVSLFAGRFADAFNIAKMTVVDFAGNVRSAAGTVSTIWDTTAGTIEGKAPTLGGKIAAPIVLAAEKVKNSTKAIKDDALKAYDAIERQLASLQFDVDTQGASDRTKGLIQLTRQGATSEQVSRYLALTDAQEAFVRATEAAAKAQRDQNDAMSETSGLLIEVTEKTSEASDLAKDLGMSFTSAAENAIVEWKGFGTVLRGIEQDIIRIVTRRLITEPLANGVSGILSSVIGAAFGGGGPTAGITSNTVLPNILRGGAATGSNYIERDMFTILHKGEAVIPKAYNEQGAGRAMTINIDMRGAQGGSRATAMQQGEQIGRGIQLAMGRNG